MFGLTSQIMEAETEIDASSEVHVGDGSDESLDLNASDLSGEESDDVEGSQVSEYSDDEELDSFSQETSRCSLCRFPFETGDDYFSCQ